MTTDLRIRPFEERDRESVVALWRVVFADDPPRNEPRRLIDRKLEVQPELFLVGELAGNVVATVLGGYDGFRGWVYHLAVMPEHQRRGFGASMMARIEAELAAIGCPKLNLQVRSRNAGVLDFYRALGYGVDEVVGLGKVLVPDPRG